jgi:oligopeptide transport system permease protein
MSGAFFIRRALYIIPVLFVVAVVTFIIMHATPGGPWDTDPSKRSADPKFQETLNRRYGLDKPLFVNVAKYQTLQKQGAGFFTAAWGLVDAQFENYLWSLLHGDLGPSYRLRGRNVQDVMFSADAGRPFWTSRFGTTALIGVMALIIALVVGVPLGTIAALKRNTIVDYVSLFFATVGYGIPNFVLGVFFILFFALQLKLIPVLTPAIWNETTNTPNLAAAFLPSLTLAIPTSAYLARLTRSSLLEVMRADYVRTARSKGLSERTVVLRHMMRNALIPVATVLGPSLATLVTGSFIIENLFAVNGIGRLFIESIGRRDYTMIMGTTLFYALLVALANLLVDFTYGFLDPRIRVGK